MQKLKFSIFSLFAILLFTACEQEVTTASYDVIPLPQSIENKQGEAFPLSKSTKIAYPKGNADLERTAGLLAEYLEFSTGLRLSTTDELATEDAIILKDDFAHDNKEAYQLDVESNKITISGASALGTFYGAQTLRKSIYADSKGKIVMLPQVSITDYPRFKYRGMMLDVARHMFPVETVKDYIDLLALHNINNFHWHLSDDQGWRIEIKKYPKLTEIGAYRKETVIGKNTGKYDGKPYGGFYTQEELKEVVAYAAARNINVIPEVDLPGHMLAALSAYPELGCTGGPYEAAKTWGVFDDILCAGNEETFVFLENVFTELLEIFPSEYIHIGGDEAPKTKWKLCPKDQEKIKELRLKADSKHTAEEKLQSYVISRMEKFLNSKGRKIIGWDEILEGGLAPNATVMSWRNMQGGITAAKQGHDVIMAPTSHVYFDYYQTLNKENEPFSIGGYVPVEKVYSLDPLPAGLMPEQAKHIIGTQANMWTEYITTPEHLMYMLLPRLDALSEVQWTMPENKDYDNFLSRLPQMFRYYDAKNFNYAKHVYDIRAKINPNAGEKKIELTLSTFDDAPIYYTTDGTLPTDKSTQYSGIININESQHILATAIRKDIEVAIYSEKFTFNKATLKPIGLDIDLPSRFAFKGAPTLVDGVHGNDATYNDGSWIGYGGPLGGFTATIDMEGEEEISSAKVSTYINLGDWIFGASKLIVKVSDDGVSFRDVASNSYFEKPEGHKIGRVNIEAKFDPVKTKYVKVYIGKTRKIPDWHPGKGNPPFIFIDEIEIN